jgi:hypothetical protein
MLRMDCVDGISLVPVQAGVPWHYVDVCRHGVGRQYGVLHGALAALVVLP